MAGGALVLALLTGCVEVAENSEDASKDPYYLDAMGKLKRMDYEGAVGAFEKALQMNPGSAPAHRELGFLHEEHLNDPAAAIYHYQRFLKLEPESEKASFIQGRINACKEQLAHSISIATLNTKLDKKLSMLELENTRLEQQLEDMKKELSRMVQELEDCRNANKQLTVNTSSNTSARTNPVQPPVSSTSPNLFPPRMEYKTHEVKKDEYPISICRDYGIELKDFMAANPGLDPRNVRVGQIVNIPILK